MSALLDHRGNTLKLETRSSFPELLAWYSDSYLNDRYVGPRTAFGIPPAYQAINIFSSLIGSFPLRLKRRLANGDTELVTTGDIASICKRPSSIQPRPTFWWSVVSNLLGWGNAYAVPLGNELYWLASCHMSIVKTGSNYHYLYASEDGAYKFFPEEILHWRINTFDDPIEGHSPVELHRKEFATARAQSTYGEKAFTEGVNIRGVIEDQMQPTKEAAMQFLDDLKKLYNAATGNKLLYLPGGKTYKNAPMASPHDMEYIGALKFTRAQIASIYNLPEVFLAGSTEGLSYNNLEQLNLQFLTYSVTPLLEVLICEIEHKLIMQPDLELEFDTSKLLRSAPKDHVANLQKEIGSGLMTINEGRRERGRNSIGSEGDKIYRPLNQGPIGDSDLDDPEPPEDPPTPTDDPGDRQLPVFSLATGEYRHAS